MNTQNQSSSSPQPAGQVQALMEKYRSDPAFRSELDAAGTPEDALGVAARHGIAVSARDITALGEASHELSDAALDRVSGGIYRNISYTVM